MKLGQLELRAMVAAGKSAQDAYFKCLEAVDAERAREGYKVIQEFVFEYIPDDDNYAPWLRASGTLVYLTRSSE